MLKRAWKIIKELNSFSDYSKCTFESNKRNIMFLDFNKDFPNGHLMTNMTKLRGLKGFDMWLHTIPLWTVSVTYDNVNISYISREAKAVFSHGSMVWFRSALKISSYLTRVKYSPLGKFVGSMQCKKHICKVCTNIT